MNLFEKTGQKKFGKYMIAYGLVVLLGAVSIMLLWQRIGKKTYYVPDAEENAVYGIPSQIELEELNPKDNIYIGFHNPVYVEEDRLYVYLTNYKESEVTISAFLYDEDKKMYASSGMIMQGQYLPCLLLNEELSAGKEYYVNVAFYNRNDMTSEGSIWVKVGEIVKEK